MAKVQQCSWQPFKLNEIVSLERCLQELSLQDPRFSLLLRKLADCRFVEPTKKQQYLKRTKEEEQQDAEFKRCAELKIQQTASVGNSLDLYDSLLTKYRSSEAEMRSELVQIEKSLVAAAKVYRTLLEEFKLSLERVYNSFQDSATTLEAVPRFLKSVETSKLARQMDTLPASYRKRLLRLTHLSMTTTTTTASIRDEDTRTTFIKFATTRLLKHIGATTNLVRDLELIVKLYSTDLGVELEIWKALEDHIGYLKVSSAHWPKHLAVELASPTDRAL